MLIPFIAILGAIIGSFLTVCIYRVPMRSLEAEPGTPEEIELATKKNLTISNPPRSFCPKCNATLHWWHNVPILSWVILGGRCYSCKAPISFRYPFVELLSASFAVLSFYMYGLTPTAAVVYAFCACLIVISFIDIDYYIIPNVISLPGTVVGLLLALFCDWKPGFFSIPVTDGIVSSLLGILAGGGFLFFISEVYLRLRKKEGLGMGDVKLLAMVGAFFGPVCALYTIFVGSLLGSIIGITLMIVAGKRLTHQLPFGPYLALGTLLYLFTHDSLLIWFALKLSPTGNFPH